MSTIFKLALGISLLAHAALFAPYGFLHESAKKAVPEERQLNYIIIPDPQLAIEEEIIEKGSVLEEEMVSEDIKADLIEEDVQKIIFGKQESVTEVIDRVDAGKEKTYDVIADRQAFLEYFNLIREKIRAKMHMHLTKDGEGVATIIFTIDPKGNLVTVTDIKTDFPQKLHYKIFRGIKRADPFPPFPKELGTRPITFSLTIKFV